MLNGKSWYQLPVGEVFKALQSGNMGLTSNEAKARLGQYGYNELEIKKYGPVVRLLLQFHNALLYVLLAAAVVAGLLGEFISTPLLGISPFRTTPFPANWWIPLILVSLLSFFIIELEKLFIKRLEKTAI